MLDQKTGTTLISTADFAVPDANSSSNARPAPEDGIFRLLVISPNAQ